MRCSVSQLCQVVFGGALVCLLSPVTEVPAADPPQFVVTDLGTLGGSTSAGYGINNLGQVSGYSDTTNNAAREAVLFSNGAITDLGTLGDDPSYGYSVSNIADVTGYSLTLTEDYHAYLYSNGIMHDIPGVNGTSSEGHCINNFDQIAGFFVLADGFSTHAFVYSNGLLQDLGTLGGSESGAFGINNSGQITGSANILDDGGTHVFLYAGGIMTDLGTLGGGYAQGYSINNAGQITGFSSLNGELGQHPFLYSGGLMQDLGTLGGSYAYGTSINNSGQVTGHSNITGDTVSHAFFYDAGEMYDLNSLVPASFATYSIDEEDIGNHLNDRGQIAAEGRVPATGNLHALLLTPRAMGTQFSGGLGELFGNVYGSKAIAVANGGSVVVGVAGGGTHASYWTLATELTDLHLDSAGISAAASGVSEDGRYFVGTGANGSIASAFRYDVSLNQNSFLAAGPGDIDSAASGISEDGSTTVGWSGSSGTSEKAVLWSGTNSPTLLGVLSGGIRSLAQSVSGDGSVVAGYSQSSRTGGNFEAFRWDAANGMLGLGDLTGGNTNLSSQAFAISQDGTAIVGQANSPAGSQAFLWTQSGGMFGLGFISGTSSSVALGVSSDGAVSVGISGSQAFVWDANNGIRNLQSVLSSEYGVVFTGWNLTVANGISPDATEVVGQGTDSLGNSQAFAAQINSRTYRSMAGESYAPFHTSHLGGHSASVDILDGIAGGSPNSFRTVTVTTSKAASSSFVSDVANISGTSSDTFVVQLSYDLAAADAVFGSDQSLCLGWFNGTSWVNALDGNTTGTPTFVGGAYNHIPNLGNCSLDTLHHVVWACVNHVGQFAVINHVPPVASYATWQQTYFTPQELADPAISGDNADPNHNGVPNLLEYAFNTNPRTNGSSTNLPYALLDPNDPGYFALVYTKFLGATDLTYSVQRSGDLSSWTNATTIDQILSDNGFLQVIKAKVAITSSDKQLFLRLAVSH